jgi:hypothetical protein
MAIAYVNSNSVYGNTSLVLNGVGEGNLLVAFVSAGSTIASTTVGDNKSNTWVKLTNRTQTGEYARIFYALNVASGNTTISMTSPPTSDPGWSVHEYSGIATTNAFDAETYGASLVAAFDSNSITVAQADELLVAIVENETNAGVITWTNSFNKRTSQETHIHGTADRIVSSIAAYNATGYFDANCNNMCLIAAFKGAATAVTVKNLAALGVG